MKAARKVELVPLADLRGDPRNPKAHATETLDASVGRFGFIEPIVVDGRTGLMASGHGRHQTLSGMEARGEAPPDGITVDRATGAWKVPVVTGWSSKSDEEAAAVLIALNRTGEAGGWVDEALLDLLAELEADPGGLVGVGYDSSDVADLEKRLRQARAGDGTFADDYAPLTEQDEIPETPAPLAKPGDMFILGRHRVLCGDATQATDVAAVMADDLAHLVFTDPPYGVDYEGKTARKLKITGDRDDDDALEQLLLVAFSNTAAVCQPGADRYVTGPSGPKIAPFIAVLGGMGIWRQILVWVKDAFVLGHSDYHYRHEVIFYGWTPDGPEPGSAWDFYSDRHELLFYGWTPDGPRIYPQGDRTQDSVWEVPRPRASRQHPTMKPVELIARALKNSSAPGDVVLDPFGGSGSTMIACEALGRACRMVEIDPRFVDVICRRWQEHTGHVPTRPDGSPVSFVP